MLACQLRAHATAEEKGWHDGPAPSFGDTVANINGEFAEAWEAYRDGYDVTQVVIVDGKPEGVPTEFADGIIRILDWAGTHGVSMEEVILQKMAYNKTRSYRHGNKRV